MYKNTLLPSRPIIEEEYDVTKFRRVLPDRGGRDAGLLQFFAAEGGMRTVNISDIVEVKQP